MPRRPPPREKGFQKGQSGNPGGRPRNPAIRAMKHLTVDIYREVIELALTSNITALEELIKDPKRPTVQVGIATALVKACRDGNWTVLNAIAERLVGKIPDQLQVSDPNGNPIGPVQVFLGLPPNGFERKAEEKK